MDQTATTWTVAAKSWTSYSRMVGRWVGAPLFTPWEYFECSTGPRLHHFLLISPGQSTLNVSPHNPPSTSYGADNFLPIQCTGVPLWVQQVSLVCFCINLVLRQLLSLRIWKVCCFALWGASSVTICHFLLIGQFLRGHLESPRLRYFKIFRE